MGALTKAFALGLLNVAALVALRFEELKATTIDFEKGLQQNPSEGQAAIIFLSGIALIVLALVLLGNLSTPPSLLYRRLFSSRKMRV
jgi:hypothetical protein